jgi:hypothetical protein
MIPMICLTWLHVTLVLQRKLCQMSSRLAWQRL